MGKGECITTCLKTSISKEDGRMFDRIQRFNETQTFEKVFKSKEDRYIFGLEIQDFADIFNIEVTYLNNSKEEEEVKPLEVHINVSPDNVVFNPFSKTLNAKGSYLLVDGILKFKRFPQHPKASVIVSLSTLSHEEAENSKRPKG